jgi:hypothetical protein
VNGKVVKPEFEGETTINGSPVVIMVGHNGEVMSTGNVTLSHEVYIDGKAGAIAWIEVNGTTKTVVVFKDNTTANATVVKPEGVSHTNVTYQGALYNAVKVVVPNVSGVITFNVTVNGSVVTVLKETSDGKLVALNSSDYFLANGRLVVVDDPTQTYYAVTGPATTTSSSVTTSTTTTSTQTSSSSQTSTTTQTSSSNTATSSTATTSTVTTSSPTTSSTLASSSNTTTSSAQTPASSSSVTSSDNTTIIIAGIIVVLIVVAALAALLRRK